MATKIVISLAVGATVTIIGLAVMNYDQFDPISSYFEDSYNLAGKKIIWQYWAQGFDGNLPEVVAECLASVDRYKGNWEVIRLSDNTISDYLDIPDFVWAKRGNGFSITAFSNVLRLALLYMCYCWYS